MEESLQDVIEYEFEKKYRIKYRPLGWWLEPGAKDLVKGLEEAWAENKIDMNGFYTGYDSIDWLKDKYKKDALDKATAEYLAEFGEVMSAKGLGVRLDPLD